jgi:hypothetical protein
MRLVYREHFEHFGGCIHGFDNQNPKLTHAHQQIQMRIMRAALVGFWNRDEFLMKSIEVHNL